MRRLALVLMVGGMLACVFALGSMLAAAPTYAQGLPERPTLTPIPVSQNDDDGDDDAPGAPTGRITGTVIDATTGAPVSGITVSVGGVSVTSDSNGNYDRSGLAAGDYPVALVLTAAQGVAEQGTITVALADGATAVQHLRFRSPVAAAPPDPVVLPATGGAEGQEWLLMVGVLMILLAGMVRRRA
jgi:LPXTG-motif cell wall-anchored protein